MALQTSGMISLNEIQIEAGDSSGSYVSINDANLRGLIGASSGAAMDFADWYGASSSVDTQTVTVGTAYVDGYIPANLYGYGTALSFGSISDGTFNGSSGVSIEECYYSNLGTQLFAIAGNRPNSGWTTMTVGSVAFSRSTATYVYDTTSNTTRWSWTTTTGYTVTNGFGTTTGASVSVVFT